MTRCHLWCFNLFLAQLALFVHATGLYSVIGPGTIRSGFKYNALVTLHEAEQPCKFEIGITGPSYNETKTVELQPMSSENLEFSIPQKLVDGVYNLTAKGIAGIEFKNSTQLIQADYKPSIYIQTDKATYKPGDLVQYRILVLDEDTRPANVTQNAILRVNDGASNLIKQIKNINFENGVHSGNFQLSDQPVLGNWNIEVYVTENGQKELKQFEVDKYVLPKFEVTVDTAKDISIADKMIKITVRAKYTYGKSVKGKATVHLSNHIINHFRVQPMKQEKTFDIDGKAHVEFDFDPELVSNIQRYYYNPTISVLAVVEEELTGNKQNNTAKVRLHQESYVIEELEAPDYYEPNKSAIVKVAVKNLDGTPVQNSKEPVELRATANDYDFAKSIGNKIESVLQSELDKNGIATFELKPLDLKTAFLELKCIYMDTSKYLRALRSSSRANTESNTEPLKLQLKTKSPRIDQNVTVLLKFSEPIKYFVYTITGRGKIVDAARVPVAEGETMAILDIQPKLSMIPKATLYVHYVHNNNLRFEELSIKFEQQLQNKLEISSVPQAKPGEDVALQISTDAGSYVGLLGVDQSVLLLKSGNDLSKEQIIDHLSDYDTRSLHIYGRGKYPGSTSGLVTLTNAHYPFIHEAIPAIPAILDLEPLIDDRALVVSFNDLIRSSDKTDAPIASKPRSDFAEVWIFKNINSHDGNFTLNKKIPDTITSWIITGFSLNPVSGIALTEDQTKIRVFQPFFLTTNLPYSVKRGEVIAIPVIIFNYMDKNLDAEVIMDNADGEFEFIEATNEIQDSPSADIKRTNHVAIPSGTGKSVSFLIRPKHIGMTTLKISAVTPLAGDSIHQKLKVEPEGLKQYQNRAFFINLATSSAGEQQQSVDIQMPADIVPDSEYIEFAVVGDLLGPTIQNIDKLVRMPYGCGEQNMVNFVPNILVLKYLETIKQNWPALTEKAKKHLEVGYQRELTYKHEDGSYSAFGQRDPHGSTWLTAYVARSFHQAAPYTQVEPKIIQQALDFLQGKQQDDGSFVEHGKLVDSAHQNELGLSAFVLLAFLENAEDLNKYQDTIERGMKYVLANALKSEDQYGIALAAAALAQANSSGAQEVLTKLEHLAKSQDGLKWWSSKQEDAADPSTPSYFYRPRSKGVEITSYALLALLPKEGAEKALPIAKWLITQRNSNGGFSSTQDTVVGLQALTKFAEATGSGKADLGIDFFTASDKGNIKVTNENALVLQTHLLPKSTRQLNFTAEGKGSALAQVSYSYHIADKEQEPAFKLESKVKSSTSSQLAVDVCAEYLKPATSEQSSESNMVVVEIALPSGYTTDTDSLNKIQDVIAVKRTETQKSDTVVVVYLDSLTVGETKCLPVEASKTHAVAKQKPASVLIYDYYDPARKAIDYYEVVTSLCDICEGEDCGSECKKTRK